MAEVSTAYKRQGAFRCPACSEMVFAEVQFKADLKSIGLGTDNSMSVRVGSNVLGFKIEHNCLTEDTEGVS